MKEILPLASAGFLLHVLFSPEDGNVNSSGTLGSLQKASRYNAEVCYSMLKATWRKSLLGLSWLKFRKYCVECI
jgi:hypothetical protein